MFKKLRGRLGGFKRKLKKTMEEELEDAPEEKAKQERPAVKASPTPTIGKSEPAPPAAPVAPITKKGRRESRAEKRASRKKTKGKKKEPREKGAGD